MDGIYAMYYTGEISSGLALAVIQSNKIIGADLAGSLINGKIQPTDQGNISIDIELHLSEGTILVTGEAPLQQDIVLEASMVVPKNFADGTPHLLELPTGPVNVIFKHLRSIE